MIFALKGRCPGPLDDWCIFVAYPLCDGLCPRQAGSSTKEDARLAFGCSDQDAAHGCLPLSACASTTLTVIWLRGGESNTVLLLMRQTGCRRPPHAINPIALGTQGIPSAIGADSRPRTGDLNLGKVAFCQLNYVRVRRQRGCAIA